MHCSKTEPLKEWTVICMCNNGRLRKNGVDVTENFKKLWIDRRVVQNAWWKEALDFYLQKQKEWQK